jgi:hypothetical protein
VMEMQEEDWQLWASLRPNQEISLYAPEDIGRRPMDDGWDLEASNARWEHINQMSTWIDSMKLTTKTTFRMSTSKPLYRSNEKCLTHMFTGTNIKILAGESPTQFRWNSWVRKDLISANSIGWRSDPIRVVAPRRCSTGRTIHSSFTLTTSL